MPYLSGISSSYSSYVYSSYRVDGSDNSRQNKGIGGQEELSKEEKKKVQELKARDKEVRAHEMAHIAAGGHYVRGGASYEYETGPDGRKYAVGGEVSIDTSPVKNDPQATIQKMRVVRKAALAPAQPSGQDRAVAAKAAQQEIKAQMELREQKAKENDDSQARGVSPGKDAERSLNSLCNETGRRGTAALSRCSAGMIDLIA